jgi:hypothetical protein
MSDRLSLATAPQTFDEGELLTVYRTSCANDQTMLLALLDAWSGLSPGHRRVVSVVADALRNATAWRVRAR